jgi:hypothetical protein
MLGGGWATGIRRVSKQERRERVRLALAVLGSKCDKASVERCVELVVMRQARWDSYRPNQHKKAAIRRLAVVLRELEVALNNPNLPLSFRFYAQRSLLSRLRAKFEYIGYGRLHKPRRNVGDKRIAVEEAASFLTELGRPLTLTRTGEFCRLAAAFFGDKEEDMLDVCRAYIRSWSGPRKPDRLTNSIFGRSVATDGAENDAEDETEE